MNAGTPVTKTTVKLSYPDVAEDEFGNKGFWTLIYNQVYTLYKNIHYI